MALDDSTLIRPDSHKVLEKSFKSEGQLFAKAVDYNWYFGICSHTTIYEDKDNKNIQSIRFLDDRLALGLSNGYCYIVSISSSTIAHKFYQHTGAVTGIDFDGTTFISGGIDGILNIYDLSNGPSEYLGTCSRRYQSHSRPITAVMLAYNQNSENDTVDTIAVTCGDDFNLKACYVANGMSLFSYSLPSQPLCLGTKGDWVAVGLTDGRVQVFSLRSGNMILEFQAHDSEVRSLHFYNGVTLFTGGEDGRIRRWDFSGRINKATAPVGVIDVFFREALEMRSEPGPTTYSTFGDDVTTAELPIGCVQSIATLGSSPVTSIQGDSNKVVSGHLDGTLRIFHTKTGEELFHIEGRPGVLRNLQYDDTRLLCTGSMNVLVMHDFSVSTGNMPDDVLAIEMTDDKDATV